MQGNLRFPAFEKVGPTGLEPIMTEPKPVVLPLHHGPIPLFACKGSAFLRHYQILSLIFHLHNITFALYGNENSRRIAVRRLLMLLPCRKRQVVTQPNGSLDFDMFRLYPYCIADASAMTWQAV